MSEILAIFAGIFTFFENVKWLILLLKKTDQTKREELMTRLREESDKFQKSGRPTWND